MLGDTLDRIKQVADITDVIRATGYGDFPNGHKGTRYRGAHCVEGSALERSCIVDGVTHNWKCFRCGHGGDVVDWVLSAKYENNRTFFRDALSWLAALYDLEPSSDPVNLPQHGTYRLLTDLSWVWHTALMDNTEALKWVQDKWGLTKETIEHLRLGFGSSLADREDRADLVSAGVLDERGNQPMYGRIVFPYFKDGLVQWMSGRIPRDDTQDVKYMALFRTSHVYPILYNYDNARRCAEDTPLIFTEGLADAARAYQAGLRAVAPGGAQMFTSEMYDDTARLLTSATNYKYIIFDAESSGVGANSARNLARTLITFGSDPFIVDLPREEGVDKVDLCDFLNSQPPERLEAALDQAANGFEDRRPSTLPNILIDDCPKAPELDQLKQIMDVIAPFDDFIATRYLGQLREKTRSERTVLKKLLTAAQKKREKRVVNVDADYENPPFYAQDFIPLPELDLWRAHTCTFVPYRETVTSDGSETTKTVLKPVHVVTNMLHGGGWSLHEHKILNPTDEEDKKRVPARLILSDPSNAWSVTTKNPHSFMNFIEGKAPPVDFGALYKEVFSVFNDYIWFEEPKDKHILTLYVFLTYIYMGLPAVPYIHLFGPKNSGKSTTLTIISELAFNSTPSSTMSPAVMFRIAHSTRPTFLLDEAEKLRNPPAGSMDFELLSLCNGSYANSNQAQAIRCAPQDLQPEAFKTYGPKVLASIQSLKDTLSSRSIRIHCTSGSREHLRSLKDWSSDQVYLQGKFQNIRDQLRIWGITQFRSVRERYDAIDSERATFLLTRDRQLWRPLMAIADLVDEKRMFDYAVADEIVSVANDKIQRYKTEESIEDFGVVVLTTLYKTYKDRPETAGKVYRSKEQATYLCPARSVEAVMTQMLTDKTWADQYHGLDALYLLRQLRHVGAVPVGAKSKRIRSGGELVSVYPFNFDALEGYLRANEYIEMNDILDDVGTDPEKESDYV